MNTDPPEHTRLRKLVSQVFTPRRSESLRPLVTKTVADLLDDPGIPRSEPVDLARLLSFPLPLTVICELLGVPLENRDDFRSWTEAIVSNSTDEQSIRAHREAMAAMAAYLGELIIRKRREPGEDLVTDLIAAHDDEDRLTGGELVVMLSFLLIAGHETTSSLISNTVLTLLRNPGHLAALCTDPTLIPSAVEESLRFTGPGSFSALRFTTTDVRLGEVVIPAGEAVAMCTASANRDSAKFAAPDAFDPARRENPHLAFGHGPHFCLGAALARVEAAVAVVGLLERFPGIRLAVPESQLRWRTSDVRGPVELPVLLNG